MAEYYTRSRQGFADVGSGLDRLARRKEEMTRKELRKLEEEQSKEKRKTDTDWWSKLGTGAAIGSMFGPVGTAIGAGAGGLLGLGKAMGTRVGEGTSPWDAFWNTLGDFEPLTSGRSLGAIIPGVAGLAGSLGIGGEPAKPEQPAPPVGREWGEAYDMGFPPSYNPSTPGKPKRYY